MKKTLFFGVFAVFALLLSTGTALALGTAAGTTISNLATVYYNVGTIPQTEVCSGGICDPATANYTTFDVDTKIDLLVDTTDSAAVQIAPGGTAYATFRVYNMGNATQDILLEDILQANSTGILDPFLGVLEDTFDSSAAVVLYEETNASALLQVGGDTDLSTQSDTLDDVIPSTDGTDNFRTVYLVITADGALIQDDLAVYALRGTVRATDGSALANDASPDLATGSEIVFADGAGTDDSVGNYDAQHSDRSAFVVNTATLTITKTVAVYDDGVAPQEPWELFAIPGSVVTYTINVANAAGGDTATAITIVDEIPNNTYYYVNSGPTGGDGTATQYQYTTDAKPLPASPDWSYNPVADGNGVDTTVTGIKIRMSNIDAGNNTNATFKVKIQ